MWHDMLADGIESSGRNANRLCGQGRPGVVYRSTAASGKPMPPLLQHSDRGSQYTSEQFQRLMADHGVICSMSRSGAHSG